MGCPSSCALEENLVFSITTHDPDTGVLTDADSLPTYRVYEEETGTAILTGTMSKLDDPSTTGFYTELIAVTLANGFEAGKTYTIYIEATVDSDTGGISYGFKVEPSLSTAAQTKSLSDSLSLSEVFDQAVEVTLVDSIDAVDLGSGGDASPTFSDIITLVEAFGLGRRLTLTDSVGLTQSFIESANPMPEDVIVLIDTITKSLSIFLSDSITIIEVLSYARLQNLLDALSLTEVVTVSIHMTLTDAITLSEAIAGIGNLLASSSYFRQHQTLNSYFRQHQSLSSYLRGGPE